MNNFTLQAQASSPTKAKQEETRTHQVRPQVTNAQEETNVVPLNRTDDKKQNDVEKMRKTIEEILDEIKRAREGAPEKSRIKRVYKKLVNFVLEKIISRQSTRAREAAFSQLKTLLNEARGKVEDPKVSNELGQWRMDNIGVLAKRRGIIGFFKKYTHTTTLKAIDKVIADNDNVYLDKDDLNRGNSVTKENDKGNVNLKGKRK